MKLLLCAAALLIALPSWSQAYKCKDNRGMTVYQGWPCDANINSNKVNTQSTSGAQFAKPLSQASADPAEASEKQAGAGQSPNASPKSARPQTQTIQHSDANKPPGNPQSESRALERKFITAGMDRSEVYARIGPPNSKIEHFERTDHLRDPMEINRLTREPIGSSETYQPTLGDDETRTIIHYKLNLVDRVVRTVVR